MNFIAGLAALKSSFIAALLAIGCTQPAFANHGEVQQVEMAAQGWPIGEFSLTDQHGKIFTQENFQGRWTFVMLGDTRCGQPCDAALRALATMYQRLAATAALKTTQVLFVSGDPQRDTPENLRRYLAAFDPRFVGVSGSPRDIKRLADDLDVTVPNPQRTVSLANDVSYVGSIHLIGPDGAIRAEFLPPFDPLLLTSKFLRIRSRR